MGCNDWMNSKGIAEEAKYGGFFLTLGGNGHLWYEPVTPMHNDCNNLQSLFVDSSLNWGNTQGKMFQN